MRKFFWLACAATLPLTACGQNESEQVVERVTTTDIQEAPQNEFGFWEAESGNSQNERAAPPPPPPSAMQAADGAAESAADVASAAGQSSTGSIPVSMPQIAYRFAYGFRLPAEAIKSLQERHADLCEAKGPGVCRIISMKQTDNEGDYVYGSLSLAVAAKEARSFGKELETASGKVDGELVSSSIDGEDLSKKIVDTEARLRARTVLRDRLMEVLRTRRGTVAELVEAERGVAQVNEEIDQARSWLNEMRSRVNFSQMQVTYESGTPSSGGFGEPIRDAWGSVGAILGGMIGFLILAVATLLPIALFVFGVIWLWRRSGMRIPKRDNGWVREEAVVPETDNSAPDERA